MLLSDHITSNGTIATALQLNVLVFLSALFVYVKQSYLLTSEKPLSESRVSPKNILSKRKEIQKGVVSSTKPPSRYLARRNSSDVLMHALSDSSLCQNHGSLSSTPSSVSLIELNKRCDVEKPNNGHSVLTGDDKCSNKNVKQQITASSENLKMAQFETHTSLRLKRPPSGRMPKNCFEDREAKLAVHTSTHTSDLTPVSSISSLSSGSAQCLKQSISLTKENQHVAHTSDLTPVSSISSLSSGSAQCIKQSVSLTKENQHVEKSEKSLVVNHLSGDYRVQPTAIIADPSSYQWLLKTLALHGVTLETDQKQGSIQEATMVSTYKNVVRGNYDLIVILECLMNHLGI